MDFLVIARIVWSNLQRNRLRSSLTAIGIIVGVACIILMFGVGTAARDEVLKVLSRVTPGVVTLYAVAPPSRRNYGHEQPPAREGLTVADYVAVTQELKGFSAATPRASVTAAALRAFGKGITLQVIGLDAGGVNLYGYHLVAGTAFGSFDVSHAATVCVLTESVAKALGIAGQAVGKQVWLNSGKFVVLGVVSDRDYAGNPDGRDLSVFIPYTVLLQRVTRNPQIQFYFLATDVSGTGVLAAQIETIMASRRGRRISTFSAVSGMDAARAYSDSSRTMSRLLASAGGLALLIGGVGVMNIMLANVAERTREIGIRSAIGTRTGDLLRQFLLESIVLCGFAGLAGVALGIAAAFVLKNAIPARMTVNAVMSAFACSVAIGVLFGFVPARRAARLDPVVALRES
ncbi:MAG: ABC transporter permease [Gammaproteobacteria bacterium]